MSNTRQDIFDSVKAAFALITKAGGYNLDIASWSIGHKHFTELPESSFPALMIGGANERRQNSNNMGFTSTMEISVVGYVKTTDISNPEVLVVEQNKLIADATKALMVDPTRGGKSTFTEVGAVLTDDGLLQPYAMFVLPVTVEYRATFAQP